MSLLEKLAELRCLWWHKYQGYHYIKDMGFWWCFTECEKCGRVWQRYLGPL